MMQYRYYTIFRIYIFLILILLDLYFFKSFIVEDVYSK